MIIFTNIIIIIIIIVLSLGVLKRITGRCIFMRRFFCRFLVFAEDDAL
jgi:hypothetical protein